ncbi:MAG: leucine--tRNA ligase [Microgenomates group bacterium]
MQDTDGAQIISVGDTQHSSDFEANASVFRGVDNQKIEVKWQTFWKDSQLDVVDIEGAKKPFYNLMMFPYPSAEGLHVGNMYAFTGSDIYGRFMRMQGYDVFEPIGLDGFGIHSENYALKVGKHPKEHAADSEKNFYNQLHKIGAMFDWTRTVETYHPDYYRWTQWVFVQMFKHGLAYRNTASVNWCNSCKTVLSDEQVLQKTVDSVSTQVCERCGNKVEKKSLEQWFFRITAYAGKLLDHLPSLNWSEKVKTAQEAWIGKKDGITITYPLIDGDDKEIGSVNCFTTRPDTNFGATFVVMAPEHQYISHILKYVSNDIKKSIELYCENTKKKSEADRITEGRIKTGVNTGLFCLNSLNGAKIPLYISDFVLSGFGTGVVVGVPAHDVRDFEFAQVFNLPVIRVVKGKDGKADAITKKEDVQEKEGTMMQSQFLDGLDIHEATSKIMDHLEEKGWGSRTTTYHLRDWTISRQRYWGAPIPMIYCESCATKKVGDQESMPGWWTVPEDQLPVVLPDIEDYKPRDDGIGPLAKHKEFFEVKCPHCGGDARRETDVCDTFLDSSWYYLRYPSVGSATTDTLPFDPELTKKWLPVAMYTGGAEHSVLHLMYSRFVTMALYDFGFLPFDEPFTNFFAHGLVIKDGAKMSKSKGNVVNPDTYIEKYGADALRMYLMFMGPFADGGDFRDTGMEGMNRFIGRIWRFMSSSANISPEESDAIIHRQLQMAIARVTDDLVKRRYNTAIAALMEFMNVTTSGEKKISASDAKDFVKILAPFAPHVAEELWVRLTTGGDEIPATYTTVHKESWPMYDKSLLIDSSIQFVIQVNGKMRETITVSRTDGENQEKIETLARGSEKIQKFVTTPIKKVIFIKNKLINFVV